MTVDRRIHLTPEELRLKDLLLAVADSINVSERQAEPLILRWAGGWVRDKLLGLGSHDIDVAVNCMTGEAFGLEFVNFCTSHPTRHKFGLGHSDLGHLGMIKANPAKSKNLATATCRVLGVDLDFVNLRKEIYSQDSRVPDIEFGTPREDALRRDATINSLFYNIHTGEVEDFTGGVADMDAKLIRTPLDPLQTFTDDPLRVLRLVRFASRLQFTIDPEAERLMVEPRVLKALLTKVSRERVGTEVHKMLSGKHPHDALRLIHKLGLYHVIFTDPNSHDMPVPDVSNWHVSYRCLNRLASDRTPRSVYSRLVDGQEQAYIAWNLAALTPWASVQDPPLSTKKPKAHITSFATRAAREGLTAPNKLCSTISASQMHRGEILEIKQSVTRRDAMMWERDRVGMAIRRWDKGGRLWKLQVLYALLVEAMETVPGTSGSDLRFSDGLISEWCRFLDHLDELNIMDATQVKPLVDGGVLRKALGVGTGKWMSQALDVCLAWQLRNPGVEDVDAAIEEVRRRREELEIPGQ